MNTADLIELHDVVFYLDLKGTKIPHKVVHVQKGGAKGIVVTLQNIGSAGEQGKGKFSSTVTGIKNGGKQRIFKSWLQIGDVVHNKSAKMGESMETVLAIYTAGDGEILVKTIRAIDDRIEYYPFRDISDYVILT